MSEYFEIHLEESLKTAWRIFMKSPEVFITISFALMGGAVLLGGVPLASLLLGSLAPAAIYLAADEANRTGQATFQSLKKIIHIFPQLLALVVVKTIIVSLGFVLLILPGVYLAVLLSFSELYVVLEGKNFLEAMQASRKLVNGRWFAVFGLCIVLAMIGFSGFLLIGIGLLLTIPLAAIALYCVFCRAHPRVMEQ